MDTIEINITKFDQLDKNYIEYHFGEFNSENQIPLLQEFAKNPDIFKRKTGKYHVVLTENQNQRLLEYLKKNEFHQESFCDARAEYLLAFSFGEKPDVNMELARVVEKILKENSSIFTVVQHEIADILLLNYIFRIDLDPGQCYITTDRIIEKFITKIKPIHEKPKIFIVAQAWHAPRCIKLCNDKGLDVVGGSFSELFSPYDSQEWVRDALRWVLKEGTKK